VADTGIQRAGTRRVARLGPEIPGIGRVSAHLEGDEMVFLIVGRICVDVAVVDDTLPLQLVGVRRRGTNPAGVAGHAYGLLDVVLAHARIGNAGSARCVLVG
jgi:hypothetical protein